MAQKRQKSRIEKILSVMREHTGAAIKTSQQGLSYKELLERVTKISGFLQKQSAKKGSIVAIINKSSWETCACFLAVIDSGCVALLIDVNWSPEWIDIVLKDAQPALILSANKDNIVKCIYEPTSGLYAGNYSKLPSKRLGKDASYIIYTSGTSGKPKGSINSIQGLTNLFSAVQKIFLLKSSDTVLQFSSPSFDAWIWDMCMAFSSGASLAIPGADERLPGNGLEEFMKQQLVTVATLTPSVLYHCKETDFGNVHTLITAAERCTKELAKKWLKGRRFFNAYGQSEATVCATVYHMTDSEHLPPIGKSIPGVDVWLENKRGQRIISKGRGEIVIGGKSVGLGYLNRPMLTANKFTKNPATFRTGDIATQDSKHILHHEGRLDRQVKVNGVRIELEKVESILEQNKNVLRAFVTIDKASSADAKLVAFVLAKSGVSHVELRNTLIALSRNNLPAQTSPIIVFVPKLPIRGSGKVDINYYISKYLNSVQSNSDGYLCKIICNVFQSCLGVKNIHPNDDFFFLGGNSLSMIQCIEKIESNIGFNVPIFLAMRNSTPKNLAKAIELYKKNNYTEDDPPIELKDIPKFDLPVMKKSTGKNDDAFVTGATGLLGAYIVRELLERNNDTKIYCLVRATDTSKAFERIEVNLKKRGLWKTFYKKRLVCLVGSLSDPHFGLSEEVYSMVKKNIGFLYHIASNVNWVFSYSALESSNVNGTKHAIELCCDSGAKLIYVSSIGVHFSTDWRSTSQFNESDIPSVGDHLLGYLRSKWVAEQLIYSAIAKGVQAYIFRPPFICEGVGSKKLLSKNDFLLNKIQACIKLRCLPSEGFYLDIYPADLLASGIVSITLQKRCANKVFQFTNPQKLSWHGVPDVLRQYGYKPSVVDYQDWLQKVVSKPNQLSLHLAYIKPTTSGTKSVYEHYHGEWPKIADDNVEAAIKDRERPPSVASLLAQYLPK